MISSGTVGHLDSTRRDWTCCEGKRDAVKVGDEELVDEVCCKVGIS